MRFEFRVSTRAYFLILLSAVVRTGFAISPPSVPGDIAPQGNPDGIVDQRDVDLLLAFLNGQSDLTAEEVRVANVFPAPPQDPDSTTNWADLIHLHKISRGEVPDFDTKAPRPVSRRYTTVDYVPSIATAFLYGANGSVEPGASVVIRYGAGNQTIKQAGPHGGFFASLSSVHPGSPIDVRVRDGSGNGSAVVSWHALESPGYDRRYAVNHLDVMNLTGLPDPDPQAPPGLAWASIAYPANADGSVAVPAGMRMPVVVFVHGNNQACDADGSGPGHESVPFADCALSQRVPQHHGYRYLMEELAGLGVFSISIYSVYNDPDQPDSPEHARGILRYLDLLSVWNTGWDQDQQNLFPTIEGRFIGRLDLQNVALVGHSRGGKRAAAAMEMLTSWPSPGDPNPNGYVVKALVGIAPYAGFPFAVEAFEPYRNIAAPYLLLYGTRDGDVPDLTALQVALRMGENRSGEGSVFNATAIIRGANHNYFNTVWTDSAALGEDNPWAGSKDDGSACFAQAEDPMDAAEQRRVAATLIKAFVRVQLLDEPHYGALLDDTHRFSALPNDKIQRILRRGVRELVEGFDGPTNAFGGHNDYLGLLATECFDVDRCAGIQDPDHFVVARHIGERWLAAAPDQTQQERVMTINFPMARDLSGKRLRFRLGKYAYGTPPAAGPDLRAYVNLVDASGRSSTWDLRSADYGRIPHPYVRHNENPSPFSAGCGLQWDNPTYITSIEVPIDHFAGDNQGPDLGNVTAIVFRFDDGANFAIDDVELVP